MRLPSKDLNEAAAVEVLQASKLQRARFTITQLDHSRLCNVDAMATLPPCYESDSKKVEQASSLDHNRREDLPMCPGKALTGIAKSDRSSAAKAKHHWMCGSNRRGLFLVNNRHITAR